MPPILAILPEQQVIFLITCLAKLGMSVVIVILKCVQATYHIALFYVCPGFVCVCVWMGGWYFNSEF